MEPARTNSRRQPKTDRPCAALTAKYCYGLNNPMPLLCMLFIGMALLPAAVCAAQVDLAISGNVNTVPSFAVFAKEANTVRVTSVTNNGANTASGIVVAIYASDVSSTVPVATTMIASLAGGATSTVSLVDPTTRNLDGGTVTYTAKLDPDNLISETDETNNDKSGAAKSVVYNGYKGKRYWEGGNDITTKHTYDLYGDVLYYTQSASAYKPVGWTTRTEIWTGSELPVPPGAAIEKALLYVSYNWDTTPGGVPIMSATFNGNAIALGIPYTDRSNFGNYPNNRYGMYAVDVTALYSTGGNTLIVTPGPGNSNALYPSTLLVVYSDTSETRKLIFLNEECDLLAVSSTDYGTTSDEATAYAPFTGMTIDPDRVLGATLICFAGSAGPDEGNILFNGATVASSAWQGSPTAVSATTVDVTTHLAATGNEAGIQGTNSGGLFALQQILVVEYTRPVAAFSANATFGKTPLSIRFTDASTGGVSSWAWDFENDGTVDSTVQNPQHIYPEDGAYTVNLTVAGPAGSDSELKEGYIRAGLRPLPGFMNPPTDPDGDGLYEDLNANGAKDLNDVVRFFKNIVWMIQNEPAACFDFNGNGNLDLNDVVRLFKEMV